MTWTPEIEARARELAADPFDEHEELLEAALAEIARLRAQLAEALVLAHEGIAYASEYHRDKWNLDDRLRALGGTPPPRDRDERVGKEACTHGAEYDCPRCVP